MPEPTTESEELNAIETGLANMLASAPNLYLVQGCECPVSDLSMVVAYNEDTGVSVYLSDFVPGISDANTKFGKYSFTIDGKVTKA